MSFAGAIPPQVSAARPNIILILTDDLDAQSIAVMPRLKALVTDQGTTLDNFYVNVSLCCPSRAALLRGQYAHNTGILTNRPPNGGFETFHNLGRENSTVATWLQAAGYRTVLLGKYLNGYPERGNQTYIPPGWDEWYSPVGGNPYSNFNYTLNENGRLVGYGGNAEDYMTDVLARKTSDFIQRSTRDGKNFFALVATYAPHGPATPAPRHETTFPNAKAPRTPSFNEQDLSDKPDWLQRRPMLDDRDIRQMDELYRKRLQSLLAVDDLIATIVQTLRTTNTLDNTYLFFTSDNGFHLGQHRLEQGKNTAYEEDILVPLIVRGPRVTAGRHLKHLTGNVDLAPTFAELAGATTPGFVDGRSLVPLLGEAPPAADAWRSAFLIEHGSAARNRTQTSTSDQATTTTADSTQEVNGTLEPADVPESSLTSQARRRLLQAGMPAFQALRTKDYLYVEYADGEREFYDLRTDPYQLQNIASTADKNLLAQFAAQLAQMRRCIGAGCRTAESATFERIP
jgi:arylsulfatase A-like enzyme